MARIRSLGRAPLYLGLVSGLLVGSVWLNTELRELREGEVNTALRTIRLERVSDQNLVILGRIDLLVERLAENNTSPEQLYVEARLEKMLQNKRQGPLTARADSLALAIVNAARLLLGKTPLQIEQDKAVKGKLEEAYLKERLRRFREAEQLYRDLLAVEEDPTLRPPLMLHLAFCILMQGRLDEALPILDSLELLGAESEEFLIGKRLRSAALRFQDLRQEPLQGSLAQQSRALVRRLEFDKAQQLAQQALAEAPSRSEKVTALWVLAEIAEQSGAFSEAEARLEQVILLDPTGPSALEARRRLVFLQRILIPQPNKAQVHEKELMKSGDQSFVASLRSLDRFQEPESVGSGSSPPLVVLEGEPIPGRVYYQRDFLGRTPLVINFQEHSGPFLVDWGNASVWVEGPFRPGERRIVRRPSLIVDKPEVKLAASRPSEQDIERDKPVLPPTPSALPATTMPEPAALQTLRRYLDKGYWIRSNWLTQFEMLGTSLSESERKDLEQRTKARLAEEEELRTALALVRIIEQATPEQESRFWQGGVIMVSGAALLGVMVWSLQNGNQLYQVYQATENETVAELRTPLTLYSALSWASGFLGVSGIVAGGYILWEDYRGHAIWEEVRLKRLQIESELSAREPPQEYP